jgi:hypothetical protein
MKIIGFIDGDFKTEMGDCKYHCSPTCHPGQVGPDWYYGCTHKAWPQNKYGDFVPFVKCGGLKEKCEIPNYPKLIGRYKGGLSRSINYLQKKLFLKQELLKEINELATK